MKLELTEQEIAALITAVCKLSVTVESAPQFLALIKNIQAQCAEEKNEK